MRISKIIILYKKNNRSGYFSRMFKFENLKNHVSTRPYLLSFRATKVFKIENGRRNDTSTEAWNEKEEADSFPSPFA